MTSMAVVAKNVDPPALVPQRRAVVAAIDSEQPLADVRTMDEWMARSLEGRRSPMMLLALFGGVALTLSAIGIYGVLAFGVAQRSRAFGIRQALGADRRAILSLVLKRGLRTAGVGVGLGLILSVALTTYLRSLPFGVGPARRAGVCRRDALLFGVAVAACYFPALHATRIDPTLAPRDS